MSASNTGDKPAAPEHASLDDAPDPDEDDLDDLDDMLDDFSSVKIGKQSAAATKPTLATHVPPADPDDLDDEEFQRQLQAGMAELMGDLDKNACPPHPPLLPLSGNPNDVR